jgi:pimeloyl-ACP methyl ester carboxylesterase
MALLAVAREQGVHAMAVQWAAGMVHPDRLQDTALMESIYAMLARKSADVFAAQLQALIERPDATAVLASCQVPTLIACGRQDSWSTVAQHQAMQALLPAAQLVIYENAGHMAPMEQPLSVAQSLQAWLS